MKWNTQHHIVVLLNVVLHNGRDMYQKLTWQKQKQRKHRFTAGLYALHLKQVLCCTHFMPCCIMFLWEKLTVISFSHFVQRKKRVCERHRLPIQWKCTTITSQFVGFFSKSLHCYQIDCLYKPSNISCKKYDNNSNQAGQQAKQ